jgi:hypothetical protein
MLKERTRHDLRISLEGKETRDAARVKAVFNYPDHLKGLKDFKKQTSSAL